MSRKFVLIIVLIFLCVLTLRFSVKPVEAEEEIVIDGKIDDWRALDLTPCGTDIEGNIKVYNPVATDLLEAWYYLGSGNLYLAIKVSLEYSFEYYEGWVRYHVLFDLSYTNESDDLGGGIGENLLCWFSTGNVGLFEIWEGEYVRTGSLGWDEHAEDSNTGYIEFKIPLSDFWKGEEITNITMRFETYDVEHKETVNTIGDFEVAIPEFSFLILPLFMIATLLAVIVYKRKHSV